jgi:plasmid stabilization system protein ParE
LPYFYCLKQKKICEFFAQKSVEKALNFDHAVFETFERLCEMPNIGAERNYENSKLFGVRLWFVKGFEKYIIQATTYLINPK